MPVAPEGTVSNPAPEPEPAVAAADRIPFVATATVTVFEPAVLSMVNSREVPCAAPRYLPKSVPVGSVMVTADPDVEVIYPEAICAAVAVAVALIALSGVLWF